MEKVLEVSIKEEINLDELCVVLESISNYYYLYSDTEKSFKSPKVIQTGKGSIKFVFSVGEKITKIIFNNLNKIFPKLSNIVVEYQKLKGDLNSTKIIKSTRESEHRVKLMKYTMDAYSSYIIEKNKILDSTTKTFMNCGCTQKEAIRRAEKEAELCKRIFIESFKGNIEQFHYIDKDLQLPSNRPQLDIPPDTIFDEVEKLLPPPDSDVDEEKQED